MLQRLFLTSSIMLSLAMKKNEFISSSKEETSKIATLFSKSLKGGELIFAHGKLGAGKTTFFQSVAKSLGVDEIVNSPSFNLLKIYETDYTFLHADYYRLEGIDDSLKDIGLEDYLGDEKAIIYVEWPEFATSSLKSFHPRIDIYFEYLEDDKRRIIIEDERS